MDRSTRKCKICGKEYPYCKTELKNGEIFRYQDVACCPEHGAEYFAQVLAARSKASVAEPVPAENDYIDDDEDDIDDEFWDDNDDEEEDSDDE